MAPQEAVPPEDAAEQQYYKYDREKMEYRPWRADDKLENIRMGLLVRRGHQ